MLESNSWLKSLMSALLVAGGTAIATDSMAADDNPPVEKCYGIVKKGMNDCATAGHSCQTHSTKNSDPNDFVYVLEGTCQKIVGGRVQTAQENAQDQAKSKDKNS